MERKDVRVEGKDGVKEDRKGEEKIGIERGKEGKEGRSEGKEGMRGERKWRKEEQNVKRRITRRKD